ncbi:MAG: hypothetical protein IKO01_10675, partial [Kiritimatiellae bacterium]|nr:hypothetical protein [Kiritimatiellia bacterium]
GLDDFPGKREHLFVREPAHDLAGFDSRRRRTFLRLLDERGEVLLLAVGKRGQTPKRPRASARIDVPAVIR